MVDSTNYEPSDRRPIASRKLRPVQKVSSWLAKRGISANAISVASVLFALAGATALLSTSYFTGNHQRLRWFVAGVCVQLRLLANLFDGMVAVESGTSSPVGELFNEVPDRVSDVLFLGALGFVAGSSHHLGYLASLLAVFVAYIRAIGGVAGARQVFSGIMAKQQRMFLITFLCLIQAFSPSGWKEAELIAGLGISGIVLAIICVGCVVTSITRLSAICTDLRSKT